MKSIDDKSAENARDTFDKNQVSLRLAQRDGEKLISRAQAKRMAHHFEGFQQVVLDFEEVSEIGQAFADELFRVFTAAHPNVRLVAINTVPAVAQMVSRALKEAEKQN